MRKHPPRLMLGGLTGRIYIPTRYRDVDAERGLWEVLEKYDVTDQFMAIKEEAEAKFTSTLRNPDLDDKETR